MVPSAQQRAIWRHYRPGQETDKRPSGEYLRVAREAIDTVSQQEQGGTRRGGVR
jgi:hypothetical protein